MTNAPICQSMLPRVRCSSVAAATIQVQPTALFSFSSCVVSTRTKRHVLAGHLCCTMRIVAGGAHTNAHVPPHFVSRAHSRLQWCCYGIRSCQRSIANSGATSVAISGSRYAAFATALPVHRTGVTDWITLLAATAKRDTLTAACGDCVSQDLASTNGTKVNGVFLRPASGGAARGGKRKSEVQKLMVGDTIKVGITTLQLKPGHVLPKGGHGGGPGGGGSGGTSPVRAPEAGAGDEGTPAQLQMPAQDVAQH